MLEYSIHMCYSDYTTIDKHGNTLGYFHIKSKISYKNSLTTSSIGTLTLIYDTKNMGKYYFKDYGHEDYIMKLEMLKNIDYAYGIKESLAKYRITESSLSRNKFKVALWQWKIYRNIEKLSLFQSFKYFLLYAYYGFTKYKNI